MFFCSQRKCSGLSCSRVLISDGIFWGGVWVTSGSAQGSLLVASCSGILPGRA